MGTWGQECTCSVHRPRQQLLQLWKLIKPLSQQLEVTWDPAPHSELWYYPGPPVLLSLGLYLSSTRSRNPKNPTSSRAVRMPKEKAEGSNEPGLTAGSQAPAENLPEKPALCRSMEEALPSVPSRGE